MRPLTGLILSAVALLLSGPALRAEEPARTDEMIRAAGIEIGGKGVKCTVLEGRPGKEGFIYTRLFGKTTNTTLSTLVDGAYAPAALDETVAAIVAFQKLARDTYKVAPERVHVVGSSGLPPASNREDFVARVKKATGVGMTFIDEDTEVALSIVGIVPRELRALSLLLDVGSGNTKGGFKPAGRPLASAAVPFGTVTFTNRVKKEAAEKGVSFAEAAASLRPTLITEPLKLGAEKMPGLAARQRVYLSGGTPWAMVSILHPERIESPYVTITAADIKAYRVLLAGSPGKFPAVDLSKIADPATREKAEKELKAVAAAFTPDNLAAGAEILAALDDAFTLKDRTLVFPRMSFVGWIGAYVAGDGIEDEKKPESPR